jgi:hypothetical protein
MPRPQFQSRDGTLGLHWSTEAPDDFDFSGDDEGYFPISRLRQQYVDYLAAKVTEYEEQKVSRHYYHGSQYTPEQVETLKKRRQPIIVFNRTGRKIDGIVGLIQRLRQDPKAYPTTPKNAEGAEIATQCVRAVLQSNRWKFLDPWCAGQASIEGIAGVELKLIQGDHQDPDVGMDFVFGDDFFYDPRSAKPDFSDARYMGIAKWLDVEAAVELFPEHEEVLRTLMVETGFDLTTHSDREYKWIYVNEKRLRLVEHWYRHNGKWFWAFYCSMILLEQGVSPFLDERRQPMSRFIMFSAAVDHDGDRYGHTRNLKGPQDELNQRRSKALHMSNVTGLYLFKGAVDDVETARRERARPDGVVEVNMGFPKPEDMENQSDLGVQLSLMQDARQEIESFANVNPAALQADDASAHSGVAINLIQKAGIAELGSYFRNYSDWKVRVYKAVWNIAKRTWQAERFIRVTDDQGLAQFIQINGMELDQYGNPVIVNAIGDLGVEIDIDDGPDVSNLMQDAYDVLKQDPTVPWQIKVFFMPIPDSYKKQVMAMINKPPDPMQQQQQQLTLRALAAQTEDTEASAMERRGRTMTHIAHAAKYASEAQQQTAETIREGLGFAQDIQGQTGGGAIPEPQAPPNYGGRLGTVPQGQGIAGTFPGAPPRVLPQRMPQGSFPQGV